MGGGIWQVLILIPKLDLRTAPMALDSEASRHLLSVAYRPSPIAYRLNCPRVSALGLLRQPGVKPHRDVADE